ncbi:MAG TPA: beta-ketoacyl-ACP synthase II [Spirochaetia bacterium]|nr:beta-ketoacyl-ACP synthase II [Spirochaetia bacterium]
MRRVVVTGMGAVSPLGVGVQRTWDGLIAGRSGLRAVDMFDTTGLSSRVAGAVPAKGEEGGFDPETVFSGKEVRRNDTFILYAIAAAEEAIAQAGWKPEEEKERERTAVIMGSAVGGFQTLTAGAVDYYSKGRDRLPMFFIPAQLINLASGQIAIRHGFLGPDFAVVGACATGAEAVATGARAILLGESDVAVVGGADATMHPMCFSGFEKLHTLSTHFNDTPCRASRPFDRGRDGFVLAEGAGALIIEEYEHARARGAEILAELRGFASASDAHHIAASHPQGLGEQRAMRWALERAGLSAGDIGYVNAHATSTGVGDLGELAAISAVFGNNERTAVSSTKSATGHTCGAAGALEAIFSVCALRSGMVPPTLNLEDPEPEYAGMNLVPLKAQERRMNAVLSNSFGFGATKVALVFSAV